MEEDKFQIEVLTRLTAIETTLKQQDYKAISEKVNNADNRSISNEKRLDKLEDKLKWVVLTIAGTLIVAAVKIIFKV